MPRQDAPIRTEQEGNSYSIWFNKSQKHQHYQQLQQTPFQIYFWAILIGVTNRLTVIGIISKKGYLNFIKIPIILIGCFTSSLLIINRRGKMKKDLLLHAHVYKSQ